MSDRPENPVPAFLRTVAVPWGGAAVVLDSKRRNTMMREEHGRRHADEAASGDEDGDFVVRHEFHGIASGCAESRIGR